MLSLAGRSNLKEQTSQQALKDGNLGGSSKWRTQTEAKRKHQVSG